MIVKDKKNNQDIILTLNNWENVNLEIHPMDKNISLEYFNKNIKPNLINEKILQSDIDNLKETKKNIIRKITEMEIRHYLQQENNVVVLKKVDDLPF